MSKSHRLVVIATQKFFSYRLSLGPNFDPPKPTLTPCDFFKIEWFPPWVAGKTFTKNEVDRSNIFGDILLTDTQTQTPRQNPAGGV